MSLTPVAAGGGREHILALRGIHKRFGAVRALQDVDFDVYAGAEWHDAVVRHQVQFLTRVLT